MGYYLGVPVRSRKLQTKVLEFLRQNMRNADELFPNIAEDIVGGKSLDVGYYFGGNCYEFRLYMAAILRWVALRAGRVAVCADPIGMFPYTVYESDRKPCRFIQMSEDPSAWTLADEGADIVNYDGWAPCIHRIFFYRHSEKPVLFRNGA